MPRKTRAEVRAERKQAHEEHVAKNALARKTNAERKQEQELENYMRVLRVRTWVQLSRLVLGTDFVNDLILTPNVKKKLARRHDLGINLALPDHEDMKHLETWVRTTASRLVTERQELQERANDQALETLISKGFASLDAAKTHHS